MIPVNLNGLPLAKGAYNSKNSDQSDRLNSLLKELRELKRPQPFASNLQPYNYLRSHQPALQTPVYTLHLSWYILQVFAIILTCSLKLWYALRALFTFVPVFSIPSNLPPNYWQQYL
jgi:hypothetical protein